MELLPLIIMLADCFLIYGLATSSILFFVIGLSGFVLALYNAYLLDNPNEEKNPYSDLIAFQRKRGKEMPKLDLSEEEIIQLFQEHDTVEQIAASLGCTPQAFRDACNEITRKDNKVY